MTQPPADPRAERRNRMVGIGLFVGAIFLLGVMDVLIKLASDRFPTNQIIFFRSAFALIPVSAILLARGGGTRLLRTGRPGLLILRGIIGVAAAACAFWSLGMLPLIDVYSIWFAAPLMITALSALILREQVGVRRWIAVAVGFIGVLVVLRPGQGGMEGLVSLGALAALAGAFLYSVAMVLTRLAGRTEDATTIVVYGMTVMVLASALTLPFAYVPPTSGELLMLAVMGLIGGIAHLAMAMAYRRAEASMLAPFEYTSLIWGLGFGWLVWSDLPDIWVGVGSTVIILSGLYVWHRETRRSAAGVVESAPAVHRRTGAGR